MMIVMITVLAKVIVTRQKIQNESMFGELRIYVKVLDQE